MVRGEAEFGRHENRIIGSPGNISDPAKGLEDSGEPGQTFSTG